MRTRIKIDGIARHFSCQADTFVVAGVEIQPGRHHREN
jgi:hypothetical protein